VLLGVETLESATVAQHGAAFFSQVKLGELLQPGISGSFLELFTAVTWIWVQTATFYIL
jgi:hypothetical protein